MLSKNDLVVGRKVCSDGWIGIITSIDVFPDRSFLLFVKHEVIGTITRYIGHNIDIGYPDFDPIAETFPEADTTKACDYCGCHNKLEVSSCWFCEKAP